MREIYAQAGGTEIIYGIALGAWLFFGGLGAALGRRLSRCSLGFASGLLVSIPLMSVFSILLIRSARGFFGILPGEFPPLWFVFLLASVPICFPAFTGGVIFAELCVLGRDSGSADGGRIFLYEAIGSSLGGAVTLSGFFLSSGPLEVSTVLLGASLLLPGISGLVVSGRKKGWLSIAASVLVFLLIVLAGEKIDRLTAAWSFPGFDVIRSAECERGRFDVVERGGERFYFYNLERVHSEGDFLTIEETVHLPASFVDEPTKFMLFGAPMVRFAGEALKYDRRARVVVVEGDELYAREFSNFSDEKNYTLLFEDPVGLSLDGRDRFQVMVLELPLPVSLSSVRLASARFFSAVRRILGDEGVLYVRFPFGGEYLTEWEVGILRYFLGKARRHFKGVRLISGDEIGIVLSREERVASQPVSKLAGRLMRVEGMLRSFRAPYLLYRLDEGRTRWLEEEIFISGPDATFPLKSGLMYRLSKQKGLSARVMMNVLEMDGRVMLAGLVVAVVSLAFFLFPGLRNGMEKGALFFAGASGIFSEVVVIFSYQFVFGDIYSRVGLLFCAYMVGLSVGAFLWKRRGAGTVFYIAGLLSSFALAIFAWKAQEIVLPSLVHYFALFAVGWGCGSMFASGCEVSGAPESIYAFDLIGSSLSAVASPFVISVLSPVVGALVPLLLGGAALYLSFRFMIVGITPRRDR